MKVKKIISVITSAVVTAACIISALTFSGSASEVVEKPSDLVLRLESDRTLFSIDEVRAGTAVARVSLYADNFNDDEKITVINGGFSASNSSVFIGNIDFPDYMGITTVSRLNDVNAASASRRFLQAASDIENHNFVIRTSAMNWMVLEDASRPIITFNVAFFPDIAEGTYTISFSDDYPLEVMTGYEFRTD